MKSVLCLFVLTFFSILFFKEIKSQNCNTFTDSNSTFTSDCGQNSTNPCPTIIKSILSCGTTYDSIILNIQPGTYAINENGTFGVINNGKNITILNQQIEKGYVIIDLANSPISFITIDAVSDNDSSTIILKGITFQNGNQSYGSVVYNTGSWINLSIENCNFINNKATRGGSFAMISSKEYTTNILANSTISISKSTFENVVQTNSYGGIFYITLNSTMITIDQSKFNNIRNSVGGGIGYINAGFMTITNSVVTSTNSSGLFYLNIPIASLSNIQPRFIFQNVNFTGSVAGISIYITSLYSITSISNCNFIDNSNTALIFGYYAPLTEIDNCLFRNNTILTSTSWAGPITTISSALLIKNSQFINNRAIDGGAINIDGTGFNALSKQVTIQNSLFMNNTAQTNGGGIVVKYNEIFLQGVTFNGNNAIYGSSIYCSALGDIQYSNTTFENINSITSNSPNSLGLECLFQLNTDHSCSFTNNDQNSLTQCVIPPYSPDYGNDGLTSGQKAGIAIGCIGAFIIFVIVVIAVLRYIKKRKQYQPIRL